jgi:hypothetical protein
MMTCFLKETNLFYVVTILLYYIPVKHLNCNIMPWLRVAYCLHDIVNSKINETFRKRKSITIPFFSMVLNELKKLINLSKILKLTLIKTIITKDVLFLILFNPNS